MLSDKESESVNGRFGRERGKKGKKKWKLPKWPDEGSRWLHVRPDTRYNLSLFESSV